MAQSTSSAVSSKHKPSRPKHANPPPSASQTAAAQEPKRTPNKLPRNGRMPERFDLIVIGSGPAGEKAAIQAAKLGRSVLLIERKERPGGNCMHTGTIPSKTLRESVIFLSAMQRRRVYGISFRLDDHLTIDQLMYRKNAAVDSLVERLEHHITRNRIHYDRGQASFVDEHTIRVEHLTRAEAFYQGEHILIATGSRPHRPDFVNFDSPFICDSDTILSLPRIPQKLVVFGGGVIGCEYATLFAHLGVKVYLVNPRQALLDFLDAEISTALAYLMREQGMRIHLGEKLEQVETQDDHVYVHLESGKVIKAEYMLYANGRYGNTRALSLERGGLKANARKLIEVNTFFQTCQPHIYAAGDVIGSPSLAATSMSQGQIAAQHAFGGLRKAPAAHLIPTGIYTIPEISTVGATEEQLTAQKVPYEAGTATYKEIARGQITGQVTGKLKLLFNRETHELLGVHAVGEAATELVHVGQAVMAYGGKVDYFVEHVVNYPTFNECYRVAALNGLNRL